jgi:transmembrane sensor
MVLSVFWRLGPSVKTVAEAGEAVVTWTAPDGSEVTLRPHSRLSRLDRSGRAYSLTGEAYFAVAHAEGAPFTVATTHGDVTVLGTRFTVATWAGDTRVFVEEGRVGVSSGTDRRVLAAGDAARSTRGGLVQDDPEATAESALDWTDSTLAFRSTPAARVAAELEHHFRIRIDLPERLRGEALTGSLPLADRDEALGQFGRVLGGRLRADANGVLRFEE